MAEIYCDVKQFLCLPIFRPQYIVVGRHRPQFGKSQFDSRQRTVNRGDGNVRNQLQEWSAASSVGNHQKNPPSRLPRDDEVRLGVPDVLSGIDMLGSLADEDTIGKLDVLRSSFLLSLFPHPTMRFNVSPIYRFDVSIDAVFGNGG